jgi:nicotinamidase-related amidase
MKALLVIDLQNDYFPGGKFPLWNTDATLTSIEQAITSARAAGIPVIHIQHIANPEVGPSPFFTKGTSGADIHPASWPPRRTHRW